MLCSMCQHGVSKEKTWLCSICNTRSCLHIYVCPCCGKQRTRLSETGRRVALPKPRARRIAAP